MRRRWVGLPPGSVARSRRAVECGGQRRRERSSSCSGTKGRRGPRSGEFPRLLERGGGWTVGVARRGALFRGQGGSIATFRTRERENKKQDRGKSHDSRLGQRREKSEPLERMNPSLELRPPNPDTLFPVLHSRSLEEYGLMSPSALLGGSFLTGAGGGEDTGKVSIWRHNFATLLSHYLHNPKPLLPDSSSWGRRVQLHHISSSVTIP